MRLEEQYQRFEQVPNHQIRDFGIQTESSSHAVSNLIRF